MEKLIGGVKVHFRGKLLRNSSLIDRVQRNSSLIDRVHCPKLPYDTRHHNNERADFDKCVGCECGVEVEKNGVWCSFQRKSKTVKK